MRCPYECEHGHVGISRLDDNLENGLLARVFIIVAAMYHDV